MMVSWHKIGSKTFYISPYLLELIMCRSRDGVVSPLKEIQVNGGTLYERMIKKSILLGMNLRLSLTANTS